MIPGSLLVELGQKLLALRHLRCIGVMICRERAAIIRQMVRERGRLQIRRILLNYTIALILFHGFGSRLGCLCLWKQVTQLVSLLLLLFNVLNL